MTLPLCSVVNKWRCSSHIHYHRILSRTPCAIYTAGPRWPVIPYISMYICLSQTPSPSPFFTFSTSPQNPWSWAGYCRMRNDVPEIPKHIFPGPSTESSVYIGIYFGGCLIVASHLHRHFSKSEWIDGLLPCHPVQQPTFHEISLMRKRAGDWIYEVYIALNGQGVAYSCVCVCVPRLQHM